MAEKYKDRSSVVAFNERNEAMVREYGIAMEAMQVARERLEHCVRSEGVNMMTNCKAEREKYWVLCNDRFRGMIFPEGAEPTNRAVPGLYTK
jgi:hypothetical protein